LAFPALLPFPFWWFNAIGVMVVRELRLFLCSLSFENLESFLFGGVVGAF
jgi:hypothetical protein